LEQHAKKSTMGRQRAEDRLIKSKRRDEEVMDFQKRRQGAEEAKLTRLRSLRLAKEAVDREALAKAKAEEAAQPPVKRTRRAKPAVQEVP
jgi:predicted acylesterase/phospholipase RssA